MVIFFEWTNEWMNGSEGQFLKYSVSDNAPNSAYAGIECIKMQNYRNRILI